MSTRSEHEASKLPYAFHLINVTGHLKSAQKHMSDNDKSG